MTGIIKFKYHNKNYKLIKNSIIFIDKKVYYLGIPDTI